MRNDGSEIKMKNNSRVHFFLQVLFLSVPIDFQRTSADQAGFAVHSVFNPLILCAVEDFETKPVDS